LRLLALQLTIHCCRPLSSISLRPLANQLLFSHLSFVSTAPTTTASTASTAKYHVSTATFRRMSSSLSSHNNNNDYINNIDIKNNINNTTDDAKVCVPCSGLDDSSILSQDEVDFELQNMPLWSRRRCQNPEKEDGGVPGQLCIARRFVTKNFQTALDAMNAIGAIAEFHGHHPDLHLTDYRTVEIVLWTHKVGGITQNDITLAKVFDSQLDVCYSPKWLKEHPEARRNGDGGSVV
jgi:pterin-4a-carbinolamine dehydratase